MGVGKMVTTELLFISYIVIHVEGSGEAYNDLEYHLDKLLDEHVGEMFFNEDHSDREKRSDDIASQTVYQFQKKQKKCKNLRSYGVASGSNALSYMSFVAAVITLVININNNINANNNNNNQVNLNFGNNNNLVSNLNQNVGNNFNLMFPPGKRRRRSVSSKKRDLTNLVTKPVCRAKIGNTVIS